MDTLAVTRRHDLTDAQWDRLEPLLPAPRRPGRPSLWSRRQLIDGIRWRVRAGTPWRDVPDCYGSWSAVYALFRRWQRDGTWARLLRMLQAIADADGRVVWDVSVDSTTAQVRTRSTVEAIVGGVTGSLSAPGSLLLGRYNERGRLRYVGAAHPVGQAGVELGPALERYVAQRHGGAVPHPWPQPLPAAWSGQLAHRRPLPYVAVRPTVVVEIEVDTAFDEPVGRWRHRVRFVRVRADLSVYDVRRAAEF
ncbi:hypothetical protein GCM10010170_058760 [Dactylosporangium salmoneum]|uniref:Insertion element IS402-like domain-containing protein n=1 Tax=Dactylosporangium salmoneum TaxID=53361 RepID=A0ABP5TVZ0_9ACTN